MRTQTTRTIAGRVNADGSVATGDGFSTQKTATGTYRLTFPPSFRLIALVTSGARSSGNTGVTASVTGNVVTVVVYAASTSAPYDDTWHFSAVGAT